MSSTAAAYLSVHRMDRGSAFKPRARRPGAGGLELRRARRPEPARVDLYDPVEAISRLVILEAYSQFAWNPGAKLAFSARRITLNAPGCTQGLIRSRAGTSHRDLSKLKEPLYYFLDWSKSAVEAKPALRGPLLKVFAAARGGLARIEASYARSRAKSQSVKDLLAPCHLMLEKASEGDFSSTAADFSVSARITIEAERMQTAWADADFSKLQSCIEQMATLFHDPPSADKAPKIAEGSEETARAIHTVNRFVQETIASYSGASK